ncbi:MAG: MBOAT family protein [Saprospiraceae bacterium]|nr:MBOAT family protein [Saprospiraceae bacterium]
MIFNSLPFFVFIGIFLPLFFSTKRSESSWTWASVSFATLVEAVLWYGTSQGWWNWPLHGLILAATIGSRILGPLKGQHLISLVGSYVFYGWWDWRFLFLVGFSTVLDFTLGLLVDRESDDKKRRQMMVLSIIMNLGFLGFFKYFNFFIDSAAHLLLALGFQPHLTTLRILLPIGISFYTFQSMSYVIDVYRRHMPAEKNFLKYAAFVSFWPQLVAGPIVRAKDFLPQFNHNHGFDWDRLITGTGRILWGFFKKCVVADSLSPFVDQIFMEPDAFTSINLLIGVIFYSFQIYCDFSGYSDIAIGFARVLGFKFNENFRTPYFSQNFSEFWTRWHISLSSWLRDYLYIPLGGNRGGKLGTYRNNMLTMLLGGLWHGANWTFMFWGFLHGMYLIGQRQLGKPFGAVMSGLRFPSPLKAVTNIALTYFFTCLAWIFVRATSFDKATDVIAGLTNLSGYTIVSMMNKFWVVKGVLLIGILLAVELTDLKMHWNSLAHRSTPFRIAAYATLLVLIAFFGSFGSGAFIYFQF